MREVYGNAFVCVYKTATAAASSHVFLDCNLLIANNPSLSSFGLLTWNAIVDFSEQCIAKLVHVRSISTLLSS